MQFIYPQLLWALAALSIPVIIHLFHFRKFKKVYFTNVRFLKEIKEEKSTRRQLRNLLVLLCRLLALSFLIFAFAQPIISKNDTTKKGKNYISIFIDNSFSMMADIDDVPLLDNAKKKAEEIISAYGPGDDFQILSHELKSSQQRWINKENTTQAIEAVELNPEVNRLNNVLIKQKQIRLNEGNHIVYFLSDFQKSITDFEFDEDSLSEINLIPLQSIKENNISIDSAWFESAVPALNQNNKLLVRISNQGNTSQEDLRISLNHNGKKRPEGTMDIDANSSKVDTINLLVTQSGWQRVEIKIDDYPIQFDDQYFMSFNVKAKLKVLCINQNIPNKYIDAVFKGLNNFELSNIKLSSVQYDQLGDYDLIILSDLMDISTGLASEIRNYTEEGGNVLMFPAAEASVNSYNNFLSLLNANKITRWSEESREVHRINTSEFVFENVFKNIDNNLKLPKTNGNFLFSSFTSSSGEHLLKYRDGHDYIIKYKRSKGHFFISAAPLNNQYNNLVLNAEIFVPLLYKVAYASTQSEKNAYTIGRDNIVEMNHQSVTDEMIYTITGQEEFIPGQTNLANKTMLSFNNMIKLAGYYDIQLEDTPIKTIAMNYDRLESAMDFFSVEELRSKFGESVNIIENSLKNDLGNIIKEKDKGITLWRWCLILALLFLAVETVLLRFWKI